MMRPPSVWGAYLYLVVIEGTRAAPNLSKITVDPAVSRTFPSAQVNTACRIITIGGLGMLDGNYVLVDNLDAAKTTPSWAGTSEYTRALVLSHRPDDGVWAIGADGLAHAFVEADSGMPPTQSSRWQVFNPELSLFEGAANTAVSISCPACTAVVVLTMSDALAPCDGPYRLKVANRKAGIFAWSHVSDERCTMLHDKVGNSIMAMENRASMSQSPSAAAMVQDFARSEEWWVEMVREAGASSTIGQGTSVVCTSAGQTTSLVFDLTEAVVPSLNKTDGNNGDYAESAASTGASFNLTSRQDGSIVSSVSSSVHIRVSLARGMMQGDALRPDAADLHLAEVSTKDDEALKELRINIKVNGVQAVTISLERAITQGVLLTFEGVEGGHVFDVSLLEKQAEVPEESPPSDRKDFIVGTSMVLEIFSAETQMVQGRYSNEILLSSSIMVGSVEANGGNLQETRITFIADLAVVDGYKLSTLHLMKHLPSNFRASTLDLSCASGVLPMKEIFDEESLETLRLCIELRHEMWQLAERNGGTMNAFIFSALVDAPTWNDVTSAHPEVAEALGDLHRHLAASDVFVMSNGGRDGDAYLLQVARLAGVDTRIVNLGALAGGYMSPLFSGATALIAPSQYVAHKPAVLRNAGGLLIKVCYPVMDAARVLEAARSCCPSGEQQTPDEPRRVGAIPCRSVEEHAVDDGESGNVGAAAAADRDGELRPARFIMVGRVSPEKTPSVFVRAMGVLQRRWMEGGGRERRPEGVVVGEGGLLKHMEGLARGLNASVRFPGFLSVDAVPCEVRRATALVLPSTGLETFGMVGPEAMLLGVPVVTFGFGGSGELVRHMENGILVAEPTPRALADALEILVRHPVLRDRLGKQARLDARRALSLTEMVACHADEIGRLANKRSKT